MRIRKSIQIKGWIGFFDKDEFGHPEEFFSVKTIDKAEKIVNQLQKDIKNLKTSPNKDFTAQSVSPKEKINVPVCQDCGEELVSDEDNERKDLRCPECWAKMEAEVNIED